MEVVIHLIHATFPTVANVEMVADLERSVIGSVRLLKSSKDHGVRRVLFISSGGTVYGPTTKALIDEDHPTDPISAYGINKLTIEVCLTPRNHVWPRRLQSSDRQPYGHVTDRKDASKASYRRFSLAFLRESNRSIFGDGSETRDYVYIEDVAEAIARIIAYDGPQRCFKHRLSPVWQNYSRCRRRY